MSAIEFEWDSRELAFWRGGNVERALARALRLSGNQAIRGLQGDATDLALRKKSLPREVITEDQSLSLPKRKDEIRAFAWTLWVRGKPVPLSKFPHIDTRRLSTRRGVLVRFGGGGTQRFAGAFVVTMRSGHEGVFLRTRKTRLPIEEVFSSRLPREFGQDVMTTYGDKTYRKLQSAFTRGLDRELRKARGAGDA